MVFVTGGTGLVGVRLIFDLVSRGENVIALKRSNTPKSKFSNIVSFYTKDVKAIDDKIIWVDGDLNDVESLIEIIPKGSKVFHCAAKVSFNPKKSQSVIDTNVEGTANLVNACLINQVEKLCHVSSIGALGGKTNGQAIDENTPWSPVGKSAYSLSKYYSELEVWRGVAEGLNAVIVNPAVILGPGDWNNGSPQLFSMIAKGLKYFTLGSTGYIDVRDVSKAMVLLMYSDINEERFLLSSETKTYKELFTAIAQSINVNAPKKHATPLITGMAYRIEKVRSRILNSEPKMTKQTHTIAHSTSEYIGNKLQERLGFSYTPISKTISYISDCYLQTNKGQ